MAPAEHRTLAVHDRGGVAVVELAGDVDAGADDALATAWDQALTLHPRAVALDFDRVGYINSTGIALVVGLLARARARDLPLRAFGLDPHYREIFEITRLADYLSIHEDEAGATGPDEDGAVGAVGEGSST